MGTGHHWTSAELLLRCEKGDEDAADELFARYVERLTRLARARLSPRLARRTDPDDVVMSAWRSFFVGARAGRFAVRRSGDLWRLLASITLHKVYRQARRHSAERRAISAERSLDRGADDPLRVANREPSPEEAIALADELELVMARLDACSRRVLELRLQGEQLAAIATATGRSERTVRRILAEIRELLVRRLEPGND